MNVKDVDKLLPQTQCEQCNYKGCLPYAEAMVCGAADIDLCPPGGTEVLIKLADFFKKDPTPYLEKAANQYRKPAVAVIREAECIGCTKCIQACPVDAIIGTNKKMHTVFAADCTGCQLCIEPCPVDCIEIHELKAPAFDKDRARHAFNARIQRLNTIEAHKKQQYEDNKNIAEGSDPKAKQAYILEAIKRKLSKQ